MKRSRVIVEELLLRPQGSQAVRLRFSGPNPIKPGQALLADLLNSQAALRHQIFPIQIGEGYFITDSLPDAAWRLGTILDLLGPLGSGFNPPARTRRWLLASRYSSSERLLPLIDQGLDLGMEIAFLCPEPQQALPARVEINPDPVEALAWADYLAFETRPDEFSKMRSWMGLVPGERFQIPGEALIDIRMPCGSGVCGACQVRTRKGWKSACSRGPVFNLDELV